MLLKLLAHGLGRKDKIRYVQSFIYTATHRDTHIHTHSYRVTQNTILHTHNHTRTLIYTATHIHSQTHKDSHRDTDIVYAVIHEIEGVRRAVEERDRKSEY